MPSHGWSKRIFDETYQQYYRYREKNGELEYHWEAPQDPGPVPRGDIAEITEAFDQNLTIGDEGAAYAGEQSNETIEAEGNYSTAVPNHYRTDTVDAHAGSESAYGQDLYSATSASLPVEYPEETPVQTGESSSQGASASTYAPQDGAYQTTQTNQYYSQTEEAVAESQHQPSHHASQKRPQRRHQKRQASVSEAYAPAEAEEEDVQAAIQESRNYYTQGYSTTQGESSRTGGYSSAATYEVEDDDGRATPTPANYATTREIEGIQSSLEQDGALDPGYRIHPSSRFQPGDVFKVHWAEPKGGEEVSVSNRQVLRNEYGEFVWGFRRFLIVANDQGHATCVPIFTYGGRACKKSGVKPNKHGIVYAHGMKPKLLPGEPQLGFGPVGMYMSEDGETITRESRINYSKLVTVEHNVKVYFIGYLDDESYQRASDAVNQCWEEKTHRKSGKGGRRRR